MRITYCDCCGAKIVDEPATVQICRPYPLIGSIDKEYEICDSCAVAFLKKLPTEPNKQKIMEIIGTVKMSHEELVKMKPDEYDDYLDSYRQGAEAALLEELKRAGAITYTAETVLCSAEDPLGSGRYNASVDVVMPKTAKETSK